MTVGPRHHPLPRYPKLVRWKFESKCIEPRKSLRTRRPGLTKILSRCTDSLTTRNSISGQTISRTFWLNQNVKGKQKVLLIMREEGEWSSNKNFIRENILRIDQRSEYFTKYKGMGTKNTDNEETSVHYSQCGCNKRMSKTPKTKRKTVFG